MMRNVLIGAFLLAPLPSVVAQPAGDLPDLVVKDIDVGRDPDGPGTLVIRFADALGRAHFAEFYDEETERRRMEGLGIAARHIYPFSYQVVVDARPVHELTGRSYLPRSGTKIVVTESYRLPDDGQEHSVLVRALPEPSYFESDGSNNRLVRTLRVPRFTVSVVFHSMLVKDDCDNVTFGDWFVLMDPRNNNEDPAQVVTASAIWPSRESAANVDADQNVPPRHDAVARRRPARRLTQDHHLRRRL